jgi:hypothetical protein
MILKINSFSFILSVSFIDFIIPHPKSFSIMEKDFKADNKWGTSPIFGVCLFRPAGRLEVR